MAHTIPMALVRLLIMDCPLLTPFAYSRFALWPLNGLTGAEMGKMAFWRCYRVGDFSAAR
jgi:hypothetical protein